MTSACWAFAFRVTERFEWNHEHIINLCAQNPSTAQREVEANAVKGYFSAIVPFTSVPRLSTVKSILLRELVALPTGTIRTVSFVLYVGVLMVELFIAQALFWSDSF